MIHFVQADVLDHQDLTGPWDMILSNPPYVLEEEFNTLPDDVRLYEPRVALVGGTTGCEIVQRLIEQSAGRLASGGRLFIEVWPSTVLAAEKKITNTYRTAQSTKERHKERTHQRKKEQSKGRHTARTKERNKYQKIESV